MFNIKTSREDFKDFFSLLIFVMSQKIVLMPLLPVIFPDPQLLSCSCNRRTLHLLGSHWQEEGKIALSQIPWVACCAPWVKLVDQRCKLGVCGLVLGWAFLVISLPPPVPAGR